MNSNDLYSAVINENPKPIPAAPVELISYRSATQHEQLKLQENGFFRQKFIETYLEDKWKAELHNRDCFLWLWEVYNIEIYKANKPKIEIKMGQFKRAIQSYNHPYAALALDFNQYPFGKQQDAVESVAWDE